MRTGLALCIILGQVNADDYRDLIASWLNQCLLSPFTGDLEFCALKLEKEYSREKAVVDKVSPLEEYEEEYEDLTEGEDVSGEESEERSGWDFFKSVIRTNLGPEVVEPDIPEESKTKKRSRPKVVVGKKRKVKKGKSDAVRSSTEKADFDMTEENEEKMETKMEEEIETTTLPPCSELLPIDIERGFKCYNDTEVWTRDPVMEKTLTQLWKSFDPMGSGGNGISLDLGIGSSIDPLHLTEVLPGSGALHVDRETSYFAADLWLWGVSIYGLSEAYLNDVIITRNKDLTEMNIAIEFRLDQLQANGTYNVTGWLGFEWIPLESNGQQPFTAALLNGTLSPQITIDTDAECDEAGEAKITELNIPLVYDTLTFDMENLDKAFDTVIQGILVVLLETQNMLAVAALRAMIAQSVGSLMCS